MGKNILISQKTFLLLSALIRDLNSKTKKEDEPLHEILKNAADNIDSALTEHTIKENVFLRTLGKAHLNPSKKELGKIDLEYDKKRKYIYESILDIRNGLEFKFKDRVLEVFSDFFKNNFLKINKEKNLTSSNFGDFITYLDTFFYRTDPDENKSQIEPQKLPVYGKFYNTTWFLYYHEYDYDQPKTRHAIITRLILDINEHNIILFDQRSGNDFVKGKFVYNDDNTSTFIIELERKHPNPKRLQLRIISPHAIEDETVLLGQYIDFDMITEIVSGSFVLENVKGHKFLQFQNRYEEKEFESRSAFNKCRKPKQQDKYYVLQTDLIYYSGWQDYIPEAIANYLSHKWKNFTRTIDRVNKLDDIVTFLDKHKNRPFREFKFNAFIEYDFFIVTPLEDYRIIHSMDYYHKINEIFFDLDHEDPLASSKVFRQMNVSKIYYTPRANKSDSLNIYELVESDLLKLRRSRIVIFIIPDKVIPASLLFILGSALEMEKIIFIFPLVKIDLLKILSTILVKKNTYLPDSTIDMEEIPNYIKNKSTHVKNILIKN